MSFVKLLWVYLKNRIAFILMLAVFSVVFSALVLLYGLALDGVVYGAALCAALCIMAAVPDYLHFCKKLRTLQQADAFIKSGLNELPHATTAAEEQYQKVLSAFDDAMRELASKNRIAASEMQDFYAMWVHQIKTPIAAMSLIIQESEATAQKAQLAQELFKIERYTEIVLSYLRLEDSASDLAIKQHKLDEIVKQAVKKYAPVFIGKNIAVKMSGLSCMVLTDDKWLVMALEQIISNALKYTQSGSVEICTEDGPILVIKDTGSGICAEDLPRIFEKGFTGYNGRMDKKATGLGLYLTKKSLDKLGHTIAIQSEENKGTAVRINLACSIRTYE